MSIFCGSLSKVSVVELNEQLYLCHYLNYILIYLDHLLANTVNSFVSYFKMLDNNLYAANVYHLNYHFQTYLYEGNLLGFRQCLIFNQFTPRMYSEFKNDMSNICQNN